MRRWWALCRASAFLRAFAAFHLALSIAWLGWPAQWKLWLMLLLAAHLLVTVLVLQPRNRWFGANLTRLPAAAVARNEVALSFDDGPDPAVTPLVLDLLDRHGVKASFFVVGEKIIRHAELGRLIVARGHRLENHSQRHHALFSLFGARGIEHEILAVQAAVSVLPAPAPHYFRPPAGFHSPLLAPLLDGLGLRLATWTRRGFDTRDGNPRRVLRRLVRNLAAGDILLLHDGNSAFDAAGTPVVLGVLPLLLDELQRRGLRAVALP